ncbi:LPD38 domain-containing protein [Barnesiella intestinihominis]|uniref:LPD38 domain-containing protein n=1 Tax=Barnesiella intestinihominis TaxID=487174 RepID=UPI003AEF1F2B
MPIYRANGNRYNIPDDKIQDFERRYPESKVEMYDGEGKKYAIPLSKRNKFQQRYEKWSYVTEETKKKSPNTFVSNQNPSGTIVSEDELENSIADYEESLGHGKYGAGNTPLFQKVRQAANSAEQIADGIIDKNWISQSPSSARDSEIGEVSVGRRGSTSTHTPVSDAYKSQFDKPLEDRFADARTRLEKDVVFQFENMLNKIEEDINENSEWRNESQQIENEGDIFKNYKGYKNITEDTIEDLEREGYVPKEIGELSQKRSVQNLTRKYISEARDVIEMYKRKDGNGLANFADAFARSFDSGILTLGATDAIDMGRLLAIANKIGDNGEGFEKLTKEEQQLMAAFSLLDQIQGSLQLDTWQNIGQGTMQSLPFLAQFALTGGVGAAASAATKAAAKTAVKKIIGKSASKAVSRIAANAGKNAAGRVAVKAASKLGNAAIDGLVGGTVMALTSGAGHTAEDVMSRMVGNHDIRLDSINDPGGELKTIYTHHGVEDRESLGLAFLKGFAANLIENGTEYMGNYMGLNLGKLLSRFKGGRQLLTKPLIGKTTRFARQVGKLTGFNGFIPEVAEEELGMLLNAATVGDVEWKDIKDPEQQFQTVMAVGIMSLGFQVANSIGVGLTYNKYRKAKKRYESKDLGEGLSVDDIIHGLDNVPLDRRADYVMAMVNTHDLGKGDAKDLQDFVMARTGYEFILGKIESDAEEAGDKAAEAEMRLINKEMGGKVTVTLSDGREAILTVGNVSLEPNAAGEYTTTTQSGSLIAVPVGIGNTPIMVSPKDIRSVSIMSTEDAVGQARAMAEDITKTNMASQIENEADEVESDEQSRTPSSTMSGGEIGEVSPRDEGVEKQPLYRKSELEIGDVVTFKDYSDPDNPGVERTLKIIGIDDSGVDVEDVVDGVPLPLSIKPEQITHVKGKEKKLPVTIEENRQTAPQSEITDTSEYTRFVEDGTVEDSTVLRIANKIANGEQLTREEEAMRQEVSQRVEDKLREIQQNVEGKEETDRWAKYRKSNGEVDEKKMPLREQFEYGEEIAGVKAMIEVAKAGTKKTQSEIARLEKEIEREISPVKRVNKEKQLKSLNERLGTYQQYLKDKEPLPDDLAPRNDIAFRRNESGETPSGQTQINERESNSNKENSLSSQEEKQIDSQDEILQSIPQRERGTEAQKDRRMEEAERAIRHRQSSGTNETQFGRSQSALSRQEIEARAAEEYDPVGEGPFGEIYIQFKGKPREAIDFLMKKKSGEAIGALYHKDVGDIDLVWGKEGTGHSDGFGLAKLVKYHPEVLDNLQDILNDMQVTTRNSNRINLESTTHKATIRLEWDGNKKNWLLTAFEKENPASTKTTDTDTTSLRGGTALSQTGFSAGKDNTGASNKQEKPRLSTQKTLQERRQEIQEYIEREAGKLNIPVRIVGDVSQISPSEKNYTRKLTSQGWYDQTTGEIVIVAPNHGSIRDAQRTLLHEAVAHYGLPAMLGRENFDKLCDQVWDSMTDRERAVFGAYIDEKIDDKSYNSLTEEEKERYAANDFSGKRAAADEYLAHFAEEGITNPSLWSKIKRFIKEAFRKIGIDLSLTDSDIAYLLWKSKNRITDKDSTTDIIRKSAADTRIKESLDERFRTVYHGSGASFDRFDHSFMGTGEGAQAYGWGTYVTEVEGIGKSYAEKAADPAKKDYLYEELTKLKNIIRHEPNLYIDNRSTISDLKKQIKELEEIQRNDPDFDFEIPRLKEYEKEWEHIEDLISKVSTRVLYTVEIPDDTGENYLDWDKPITKKQIKRIQDYLSENYRKNKLDNFNASIAPSTAVNAEEIDKWSMRGKNIYKTLENLLGGDREASEALLQCGFTGIKYPAQATTGGRSDGARNYVIFNENDLQITDHTRYRTSQYTPEEQAIIERALKNGTYMKAPNGADTNLTPKQWAQVRTNAFKDWFGDWENSPEKASKVVDENGEPKVVFHGTPLRRDQITPNRGWQKDGITYISQEAPFYTFRGGEYSGMIFTSVDAEKARSIAEKRAMSIPDDMDGTEQWTEEGYVYDLFVDVKNPFVPQRDADIILSSLGDEIPTLSFYGGQGDTVSVETAKEILNSGNSWLVTETPQFVAEIKKLGYDGLIGTDEGVGYIACFNPNQLKDAYDNTGAFSTGSDDIRFRTIVVNPRYGSKIETVRTNHTSVYKAVDKYLRENFDEKDYTTHTAKTGSRYLELNIGNDTLKVRFANHTPRMEASDNMDTIGNGKEIAFFPGGDIEVEIDISLSGDRSKEIIDLIKGMNEYSSSEVKKEVSRLIDGAKTDPFPDVASLQLIEELSHYIGTEMAGTLNTKIAEYYKYRVNENVYKQESKSRDSKLKQNKYVLEQYKTIFRDFVQESPKLIKAVGGGYWYNGATGSIRIVPPFPIDYGLLSDKLMSSHFIPIPGINKKEGKRQIVQEYVYEWSRRLTESGIFLSEEYVSEGAKITEAQQEIDNIREQYNFWVKAKLNTGTSADIRYRTAEDMEEVNQRFNEELEQQIEGRLEKGHVYQLGRPSEFLRDAGIPDLPIEMPASQLEYKSTSGKHDYDLSEVINLPNAIAHPIATFAYGDSVKSQNILTVLEHNGENFLVGMFIRPKIKGNVLEVNSIRNVFPKNGASIVKWINQGKLTNVDKEKLLHFLDQQRTNLADVAFVLPDEQVKQGSAEVSTATNIVENFENPKLTGENSNGTMNTRFRREAPDVSSYIKISMDRKGIVDLSQLSPDQSQRIRKSAPAAYGAKISGDIASFPDYQEAENCLTYIFDNNDIISDDIRNSIDNGTLPQDIAMIFDAALRRGMERRVWIDRYQPLEALQKLISSTLGKEISEKENAWEYTGFMDSRIKAEADEYNADYYLPLLELYEKIIHGKNGVDEDTLVDYMLIKHGIERNQVMRREALEEWEESHKGVEDYDKKRTGYIQELSTRDYSGYFDRFKQEYAQNYNTAEDFISEVESLLGEDTVINLWEKIKKATNKTLDISVKSGLVSKEDADTYKKRFQFYVPLRGFSEETMDQMYDSNIRINPGSTVNKQAKGRTSRADNPLVSIMAMANTEIARANKNKMKQRLLTLLAGKDVRNKFGYSYEVEYKDGKEKILKYKPKQSDEIKKITTISNIYQIIPKYEILALDTNGNPILDEHGNKTWVETDEVPSAEQLESGMARFSKAYPSNRGTVHKTPSQMEESTVDVFVAGKKVSILFTNPLVSNSINGRLNLDKNVPRKIETPDQWYNIPGWLTYGARHLNRLGARTTRALSQFYTTYSPAFFLFSNFARDFSGAFAYNSAEKSIAEARQIAALAPDSFAAMRRYIRGESKNKRYTIEEIESFLDRMGRKGKISKSDYDIAAYLFVSRGGETGYISANTVEDYRKSIDNAVKYGTVDMNKQAKAIKKGYMAGVKAIQDTARLMESVTRLNQFVAALREGKTIDAAITDAKNVSTNFNRRGSHEGIQWIFDNYAFLNASLQGTDRLYRGIKKYKKGFAKVIGTIISIGFLDSLLCAIFSGDDDRWGDAYHALPETKRYNNLVIPVGEGKFIFIPLAQSLRGFHAWGIMLADIITGYHKKHPLISDPVKPLDFFAVIGQDIVPITYGSWTNAAPTWTQPIAHIAFNENFMGRPLYKETPWNENLPEFRKAYGSTPKGLVKWSEFVNEMTGGNYAEKGWLEQIPVLEKLNNPAVLQQLYLGYVPGLFRVLGQAYNAVDALVTKTKGRPTDFDLSDVPIIGAAVGEANDRIPKAKLRSKWYEFANKARDSKRADSELLKELFIDEFIENTRDSDKVLNKSVYDGLNVHIRNLMKLEGMAETWEDDLVSGDLPADEAIRTSAEIASLRNTIDNTLYDIINELKIAQ